MGHNVNHIKWAIEHRAGAAPERVSAGCLETPLSGVSESFGQMPKTPCELLEFAEQTPRQKPTAIVKIPTDRTPDESIRGCSGIIQ